MKDLFGEVWRPVPGFPGYEASSHGRVRSYHTRNGKAWHIGKKPRRILKPCIAGVYPKVNVMGTNGKEHRRVPALVMLAFHGPPPEGEMVCHEDGNPENNHIYNLRYDTWQGNMEDSKRHHAERRGKEIAAIRRRYATGECAQAIGDDYGYSQDYIRSICNGRGLAYMPGPITKGFRNLKITHSQREKLREDYNTGEFTFKELGRMYGISESHACRCYHDKVAARNR